MTTRTAEERSTTAVEVLDDIRRRLARKRSEIETLAAKKRELQGIINGGDTQVWRRREFVHGGQRLVDEGWHPVSRPHDPRGQMTAKRDLPAVLLELEILELELAELQQEHTHATVDAARAVKEEMRGEGLEILADLVAYLHGSPYPRLAKFIERARERGWPISDSWGPALSAEGIKHHADYIRQELEG